MENNIENNSMNKDISAKDSHFYFNKVLGNVHNIFTPEYLKELAKKSYIDDRIYPENFSNWYPHIIDFGRFDHADIISNQVFTFEEVQEMQKTDEYSKVKWNILNKILKPTLEKMDRNTIYSIKNGCFSNKFDFTTSLATSGDLAQQLWKINYMSSMFETGGYTELVVRKYIPCDTEHCLTIYNGMPLRTEVRVFYNMETKKIEYAVDYWDYNYCVDNIRNLNDRIIFDVFHNKTGIKVTDHQEMYEKVLGTIEEWIDTLKFDDTLKGVWSIDFMQSDTGKIYLIDMARGFRSAYWNMNRLKSDTRKKLNEEMKKDLIL